MTNNDDNNRVFMCGLDWQKELPGVLRTVSSLSGVNLWIVIFRYVHHEELLRRSWHCFRLIGSLTLPTLRRLHCNLISHQRRSGECETLECWVKWEIHFPQQDILIKLRIKIVPDKTPLMAGCTFSPRRRYSSGVLLHKYYVLYEQNTSRRMRKREAAEGGVG